MKKIILPILAFFICISIQAQDYVDIVKLSVNNANLGNVDNDYETSVNNVNFEVYYPTVINDKLVVLTGITAENTRLNISEFSDRGNLTMTRLNLGIKYQHSEKWSGTYVLLPKLASDFEQIGSQDFQFGAIAILDYQANENYKYKFGLYSSTENFGTTLTPIVGLWHRSKNEKFYINATLPIRMDVNYALTNNLSVGSDLLTSIKSYNLSQANSDFYVQEESIRLALYASYGLFDNSLLLRAKVGFDTTDYGLYSANDTVGLQILTAQVGGDDRNRLNSEFDSAIYLGADLIYRFDLAKKKQ
uniref:DUF6268 family outer membrane beta-barrel protein n=1 Tax=Flavobacterium sp. TaxID=239 RepID=UPI00404A5A6E